MKSSAELTSQKLALAGFDLALQRMKRDMESNWSNLSVVNAKYGYQCQDLLKDPQARMKYWLEKKDCGITPTNTSLRCVKGRQSKSNNARTP